MSHPLLEQYETILLKYRLRADYIEDYGKVKKVFTPSGVFALKQFPNFNRWHSLANVHRLLQGKAIPIYPTSDGRYFIAAGDDVYYLMPWIFEQEEQRSEKHLKMFRDLAHIHQSTIKEIEVKEEDITNFYNTVKKQREKRRDFLQSYVEACEDEWYMSPFQLQFCTFFHETMRAYWFSITQLENWYEKIKEVKKCRVAVVHGRPSLSHYVHDKQGNGYFLSFERSHVAPPLSDIICFFRQYLHSLPIRCDECISWIVEYDNVFSSREEEKNLFLSYFSEPLMIYRLVANYAKTKGKRVEREHVARLQRAYWEMKNIEYVIGRLGEIEEKKHSQEESHATF